MNVKHVTTRLKRTFVPQGILITMPDGLHTNASGNIMLTVKVTWWYMPVLIVQTLRKHKLPVKLYPSFFLKYYLSKGTNT